MQGVCYDSNGIGSLRSCAGRVDRELTFETSDGNIFAVILPESIFKCKGYVIIVMELVR